MSKTVFLFSGQGSQYCRMGVELAQRYTESNKIYECAGDITGINIKSICEEGTVGELSVTKVSQPAIMTVSLIALQAMKQEGISFQAVAGHSLGEYAAMVASGVVSMEDGYRLIAKRSAAMQLCANAHPGAMYAVMGASSDELQSICNKAEGYVVPVNYNSPSQTVIAGEVAAVTQAVSLFTEIGKKCIKLAVNAAFHSELMRDAAVEFKAGIGDIKFSVPTVDFYSNITGELLKDLNDMPTYLSNHIVSPVQFVNELNAMQAGGIDRFIELGPNKVLTGLVKKTLKGSSAFNVEDNKTLNKLLES